MKRVLQEFHRNVDVGHLLAARVVDVAAVAARVRIGLVLAEVDRRVGQGVDGIDVRRLALRLIRRQGKKWISLIRSASLAAIDERDAVQACRFGGVNRSA